MQTAADQRFAVPAYCLMPDHAHLLVEGTTAASDLRRFVSRFKQQTGFTFAAQRGARLWQDGYHDRIPRRRSDADDRSLHSRESRQGRLVARFDEYPHSGSDRYSLEELAQAVSQG